MKFIDEKLRKFVTNGSKSKKQEHIEKVCRETGWDFEKAKAEMEKAKEIGMPYFRYVKNECWNMDLDKIKELNEKIENKIKARKEKEKEHVEEVCRKTGWDFEKAKAEMEKAKEVGMPYFRYVKNECWNMDLDKIKALNEKIVERKRLKKEKEERRLLNQNNKEKFISDVCRETGWDFEKAKAQMEKAKEMGIPYKQYAMKFVYELDENELKEFAEAYQINKKRREENKEFYIDQVCRKTGWDRPLAIENMEKARKHGITYLKFVQKEIWGQENPERAIKFIVGDKKRIGKNKQVYTERICEKTGWSKGKAELEVLKAKGVCGASYEDFLLFRMYEKTPQEQAKYVTLDMFNKMRIKYNNHFTSADNFDNKANFNKNFSEFIKHKWFVNEDLSYEQFLEKIEGLNKVIAKPLSATQGIGIQVFKCNESEEANKKLYEEIMALPLSIVEEYIVQNKEIAKFCESSVNTIRIMTLNYKGECKFLYSVFRMGRDGVVDNFHAGGIAASVDVNTGIVYTNAADLNANVFENSPSTGVKIKGFQIPNWDIILDTCKKMNGKIKGTDLVGWDFAITDKGVDLIEGNPGASYVVAQVPNIEENIGLAEQMAYPYL